MGISNVLDMGRTSLAAQRLALEVTGENITNVSTPGYSRQTTVMETAPVSLESGFPLGNGVRVTSIQRDHDAFLQLQLKKENSTLGQFNSTLMSMKRVEQVFNEFTTDGLGKSLTDFFNSWQDLSMNPQGQAERQNVLARSQVVVDNFHRLNTYLNDVKKESNDSLNGVVNDINDKMGKIASLNGEIKEIEVAGARANELRDRRDVLVQELAKKVGINYLEQQDGTVNISLTLGQPLVDGNKSATFSLQADALNSGFYKVLTTPPGGAGNPIDITSIVGGAGNSQGEIGGLLQMRDTTANGFLSNLDELAYTFANQVNSLHASGFGLTGSTGNNLFAMPTATLPTTVLTGNTTLGSNVVTSLPSTGSMFVGMLLTGPGVPQNSTITQILGPNSVQISNNASATGVGSSLTFVGTSGYSGNGGINLNITNNADVAAASTNPTLALGGTGNNINARAIAELMSKTINMSSGATTINGFYDALVGKVGVAVQNAQRGADQSDGILKQLSNLRDSTVGVSLDEELANLVKYQRAYQSAAKLITTGDEMMDTVLNMIK